MKIGSFVLVSDGLYSGDIRTLGLSVETVIIARVPDAVPPTPDYRVLIGQGNEAGVGWSKPAKDGSPAYISVKLDDPSFPAPINAKLERVGEAGFKLVWIRPRAAAGAQ